MIDRPDRALALICAVPQEAASLRAAIDQPRELTVGHKPAISGKLEGKSVILLPAGMGKTNVAHALTALLETKPIFGVVGFGIAGAYPNSGINVGSVILASCAIYGDEGVEGPEGWISTEAIGIPLLERESARHFNEFQTDPLLLARALAALQAAGMPAATGPAVTLSACSGTAARAAELESRFHGSTEDMETAALAHICAFYQMPFLSVRGVSNRIEDRDLSRWKIADAAEAAQRAVRIIVKAWEEPAR